VAAQVVSGVHAKDANTALSACLLLHALQGMQHRVVCLVDVVVEVGCQCSVYQ
jgi:hypothetical protein